ncbi:MAG: 50S ribosome-binding GTPase [Candidatus Methanoplasma sp.]|jgi:nucleolar GTP-binding protein|nr:50S ribosome-binding GTPase [Candidatus Methanoplasma sp.]
MAASSFKIPTVLSSEELMDKAYHRAAKITKKGSDALDGKKKTTLAKVTASGDIIVTTLNNYTKKFPRMEKEEDFFPELVDLVIGIDAYKKSLGALNWASNRTEKLKNDTLREVRRSKDAKVIEAAKNSFYGRLSSYLRQIDADLLFLQEAKNKFRKLPAVDPKVPTVVVAGFPNVGKSSLVKAMSTAAPQVASYPFTTKGIIIGHIKDDWRAFQIIDTPGLLDREFEERNAIEKQAVLALRYLTDVMIFILDPSESCGFGMDKQLDLLGSVKKGFTGVPIIVAESKSDILRTDTDNLHFSAETGDGMEELTDSILTPLRRIFREKAEAEPVEES